MASALCGMATSLNALIAFRVLQGLAGGVCSRRARGLLDPSRRNDRRGHDGVRNRRPARAGRRTDAGGYITDNYGWMWIFYLNVPVGILALILCHWWCETRITSRLNATNAQKPPAIRPARFVPAQPHHGLLEIMLSKGQEWDWLGDPFWRVQTLLTGFVLGLSGLIFRETRIANPLINFRTLLDRNFRTCCIVIFCAFGVLYANTTTLPSLLQSLYGYDATTSGLVLSPPALGRHYSADCRNALSKGSMPVI